MFENITRKWKILVFVFNGVEATYNTQMRSQSSCKVVGTKKHLVIELLLLPSLVYFLNFNLWNNDCFPEYCTFFRIYFYLQYIYL